MTFKKHLINKFTKIANDNNYHVIPDWHIGDHAFVTHLKLVIEQFKVDCILDVGANTGQYATLLRERVGYTGQILSFEPVSHHFATLSARAASDPNWRALHLALGAAPGQAEINVTKAPSRNSLLEPRKDVVTEFWSSDAVSCKETVEIDTVDRVLERERIDIRSSRVYLKMDTQGFDLDVMRRATKSISFIPAIQTEASIQPIYHGMPNYREVLEFTGKLGFEISGMFPVSHDVHLRMVEFDCLMVRPRLAL